MKTTLIAIAAVTFAAVVHCEENTPDKAALLMQRTGGFVIKEGSAKGKIAVFNAQDVYDASAVIGAAHALAEEFRYVVAVPKKQDVTIANASLKLKESGAGAGVFLVNVGDGMPAILAAPDDNWAVVNVAAFNKNDALLKKQVLRAFAMGAGGCLSQTPITLMGPFKNSKQIAAIPTEKLPMDTIGKVLRNLKEYGVEQYLQTTYLKACRDGWAPAPTNDVQQAIWDKVHALPLEPLKIKPETTKQK